MPFTFKIEDINRLRILIAELEPRPRQFLNNIESNIAKMPYNRKIMLLDFFTGGFLLPSIRTTKVDNLIDLRMFYLAAFYWLYSETFKVNEDQAQVILAKMIDIFGELDYAETYKDINSLAGTYFTPLPDLISDYKEKENEIFFSKTTSHTLERLRDQSMVNSPVEDNKENELSYKNSETFKKSAKEIKKYFIDKKTREQIADELRHDLVTKIKNLSFEMQFKNPKDNKNYLIKPAEDLQHYISRYDADIQTQKISSAQYYTFLTKVVTNYVRKLNNIGEEALGTQILNSTAPNAEHSNEAKRILSKTPNQPHGPIKFKEVSHPFFPSIKSTESSTQPIQLNKKPKKSPDNFSLPPIHKKK